MSAISTILTRLRAAIWAIDVRDDIANAIEQCYSDVSNPTLQTEALEAALQEKIDQGEMAALTIGDHTITAVKLAQGVIDNTLATSGAAADAAETGRQIGLIKADLDAVGITEWNDGKYIKTNIDPIDVTDYQNNLMWKCMVIAVNPGDLYTLKNVESGKTPRAYCIADSEGNVLEAAESGTVYAEKELSIPSNGAYLVVHAKRTSVNSSCYKVGNDNFTWVEKTYLITDGGTVRENSNTTMTYTIANCNVGDTFIINAVGAVGGRAWAFLDSENNVIANAGSNATVTNLRLVAPPGADKIAINCKGNGITHGLCYKLNDNLINKINRLEKNTLDFEHVTPEMYGAVGDGATDDGPAIKLALAGGGKTVVFSQKTYKIDTVCNVYSNTRIIGNNTKIIGSHIPFIVGEAGDYAYAYDGSNNVEISGLDFDNGGVGYDHIIMAHAQNITVRDCIFRNNLDHSIELNSSKNVTFDNCVFLGIGTGITNKEAINIDPAAAGHTARMGYFDNTISDYVKIINCLFENCWAAIGNHGETPYASANIILQNCDIRGCYRGAHLHSYKNVIIQNCLFSDISDVAIRMVGTNNVQVIGNQSMSVGEFVKIEGADKNALICNNIVESEAEAPINIAQSASGITVSQNIVSNISD